MCQAGWFGSGCDQFCDGNSTYWTCDDQGNKICNGNREGRYFIIISRESDLVPRILVYVVLLG